MPTYAEYTAHLRRAADVNYAVAVLNWDQETKMPPRGAALRAQQTATLSGIAHGLLTSPELGELLTELDTSTLDPAAARNVALSRYDYDRATKLDTAFVVRQSEITSRCFEAWRAARAANDFAVFAPALTEMVAAKREEAERRPAGAHPYDALLESYEPGCRVAFLDSLFGEVRRELVAFVARLRARPQLDDSFLRRTYGEDRQWQYGLDVLGRMGYAFDAGRQDRSAHPFTINFSPEDVRVTTRVDVHNFAYMLWSTMHEGGHALYEQGLPVAQYGLPLGQYCSLGVHESQSRLWENHVGRSRACWVYEYPLLQKLFPEVLTDVSLDQFYAGINRVAPNYIRTEADELHYHLHVMVRYELEKALVEGSLAVVDLEAAWNERYRDYLGVEVPDANRGVLQDVHWSHGLFGYFPTYSLGSFYAAQYDRAARAALPDLDEQLAAGNYRPLLDWLRTQVHQHGRRYGADELCRRATGEGLSLEPFMAYAKAKYGALYGLD